MLPFHHFINRFRQLAAQDPADDDDSSSDASSERPPDANAHSFSPSISDVFRVRYLLQWKLSRPLPEELVDLIIDAAEYWPSVERSMEGRRDVRKDRDQVLLKTVPLCYDRKTLESSSAPKPLPHRTIHPCRKIVFDISSHDQGHGLIHENMYEGSCTWFDAEVIRGAHKKGMYVQGIEQELLDNERGQLPKHYLPDDQLLLPRDNRVRLNGAHVAETQHTTIVWHYLDNINPESPEAYEIERTQGRGRCTLDGRGVRQLEVGDSIALWARARFPGWTNRVFRASVRIFWAV